MTEIIEILQISQKLSALAFGTWFNIEFYSQRDHMEVLSFKLHSDVRNLWNRKWYFQLRKNINIYYLFFLLKI